MKLKLMLLLFILITTISCHKKSSLEKEFNCSNSIDLSNSKEYRDIKKNYKISIPIQWKTKLYFDEYQSDIFTADTIKQLSDSYIIDTSWKMGELNFDEGFISKINSQTDLEVVNSKLLTFLGHPTYWSLSEGKKGKLEYHIFNLYIKTSFDSYLLASAQIYGNQNIEKRLCESISIFNTIKIL
jgi:hypothetical protein